MQYSGLTPARIEGVALVIAGSGSLALLRNRMPANYPTIALVMLTIPDNVFQSG
jgi:hypothetical protein